MTGFPVADVSRLAENESWRKEIHRPIYHIHKWWAQRLGSVFRAILLHLFSEGKKSWDDFYQTHLQSNITVLDPFMGSGTTLGEALKLGANVIGCDINPISSFLVEQELTNIEIEKLDKAFTTLEKEVKDKIAQYYITEDGTTGEKLKVLYYFWVKMVRTPSGETIPLFSRYVFSQNAYPSKKSKAQILCPHCWGIFEGVYNSTSATCPSCSFAFNPQIGPAKGATVIDSKGNKFKIKDLIPSDGSLLAEKMYALLAVDNGGNKVYKRISSFDETLYKETEEKWKSFANFLPTYEVKPGTNTDQARGYNYRYWVDFFNSRQRLCLSILLDSILKIEDKKIRNQFLCLFSSTLEFNNTFCSFKGEGTGAIRPIFSNHILKPERTPIENSIWGSSQGSGTFASLYRSRLLKAKAYLNEPFEIKLDGDNKAQRVVASLPITPALYSTWPSFSKSLKTSKALILNGDSAHLPLPDESVDYVVTDPPYFDFINYSELSDFFYAWLSPILKDKYSYFRQDSSRRDNEVQHQDASAFGALLGRVFKEVHRVLEPNGKLAFSFHHSKIYGWKAVMQAIQNAQLYIVDVFPVHAELMASTPKAASKEPISIDAIIVCSKNTSSLSLEEAEQKCINYADVLFSVKRNVSRGDIFVVCSAIAMSVTCELSFEDVVNQLVNSLTRRYYPDSVPTLL